MRLNRSQRCSRTPVWVMCAAAGSGLGTAAWTARTVWTGRGACDPIACVVPRRTDNLWAAHHHPGFVADDERRWHVALQPLGRRPHHRRRLVHRRRQVGADDSRRARVGVPPAQGQGESRIHLSRVKRLAVVGACLALALTGCSFQGLSLLALPGAVGRGSDAVTYHVEVPNVATLESNSPVMINDVVVGSVGKMTVDAWHANVEIVKPDVVVPANAVATVGQTSLLGVPCTGAQPAARRKAKRSTAARSHHRPEPVVDLSHNGTDAVVSVDGRECGGLGDRRHHPQLQHRVVRT